MLWRKQVKTSTWTRVPASQRIHLDWYVDRGNSYKGPNVARIPTKAHVKAHVSGETATVVANMLLLCDAV